MTGANDMSDPLIGSVVLVTGASGGIGFAIADRLVSDGATVVAGVQTETLAETARRRWDDAGHVVDVVVADLRERDACRALVDACVQRHGRIDVLVNNAAVTGSAAHGAFLDYTDEAFDELMDVNVGAAFRCSQQAARNMKNRGSGVVVNIGSVGGLVAQFGATPYGASKAALLGLTRGIALELGSHGVRSVYVAPGDIDVGDPGVDAAAAANPWQRSAPLGRRGAPSDVAAVVSFLCSSDAQFVSGTSWAVDGGWLSY